MKEGPGACPKCGHPELRPEGTPDDVPGIQYHSLLCPDWPSALHPEWRPPTYTPVRHRVAR